ALVTGIHGGDPTELDVRAAFPRLARYEAESGSVVRGMLRARSQSPGPRRMWSFPEGLREVIDALAARLRTPPLLNAAVRTLKQSPTGWVVHGARGEQWPADAVVLTCPAPAQAAIIGPLDAALAGLIGAIEYNRIAVVALGYRESDVPNPA